MRDRITALLDAALKKRGISDADEYLSTHGEAAGLMWPSAEVSTGGSVHLAMQQTVSREEIEKRLQALRTD